MTDNLQRLLALVSRHEIENPPTVAIKFAGLAPIKLCPYRQSEVMLICLYAMSNQAFPPDNRAPA
jgi:hypothetical protein